MAGTANSGLSSVHENSEVKGEALEEGFAAPTGQSTAGLSRKLSTVSSLYDRNGKGYLDPTEAKMRELDTSDRGFLSNDKIYDLMKESVDLQKQMVTQKRLVVGLVAFSVILALANMGTSFAAASLAKETTVNAQGDLAGKNDEERLGTTPKGHTYSLNDQVFDTDRRLQQYNVSDSTYMTFPKQDAEDMWSDWSDTTRSIPVRLKWTCGVGGMGSTVVEEVIGATATPVGEAGSGDMKYEYSVVIADVSYAVGVDCQDDDDTCLVTGTNCCLANADGECGAGNKCLACGCRCVPMNSPEPRCLSYCDGDFGGGII